MNDKNIYKKEFRKLVEEAISDKEVAELLLDTANTLGVSFEIFQTPQDISEEKSKEFIEKYRELKNRR